MLLEITIKSVKSIKTNEYQLNTVQWPSLLIGTSSPTFEQTGILTIIMIIFHYISITKSLLPVWSLRNMNHDMSMVDRVQWPSLTEFGRMRLRKQQANGDSFHTFRSRCIMLWSCMCRTPWQIWRMMLTQSNSVIPYSTFSNSSNRSPPEILERKENRNEKKI